MVAGNSEPGTRDAIFLGITAGVTILYQFSFFVVAYGFRFDKVTDFAGTTNFVVLAILTFLLRGSYYFRQVILTTFVIVWGLRLGGFLLLRILNWGEDKRFDDKRNDFCKFLLFWVFQAVWVWTVSLPVTIVNASGRNPDFESRDVVGWVLFGLGLVIEAIADQNKLAFKNNPQNKGKWCDAGLWSWSRHPNYFGEILLWWGIFVSATPVLGKGRWAVVVGPVLLTCLLLFVSGIPLLESSADKRFMMKSEYRQYKKVTSVLIPLPPALYGKLPLWFKQIVLFEFPFYTSNVSGSEEQLQGE
ncbi:hypothetical protein R1flu_013836 [Riccia fluitans]|uniref:Steroid 5-alpha reductase C-terminal domain-containing protein n=1 Tax=Riccia fluitans TaxID=41844 RepID=A0ABD1YEP8_9MARC